jgi:hypothetical protein
VSSKEGSLITQPLSAGVAVADADAGAKPDLSIRPSFNAETTIKLSDKDSHSASPPSSISFRT